MADNCAFATTANYFAERARNARDPDDRARLIEAACFYRSLPEVADSPIVYDPEFWRDRAQDMRTGAALLIDDEEKQAILSIATDYDRLAERAEGRR